MRTMTIAGSIAAVVIAAAAPFAGCVDKNHVDAGQVQEYADPITENILLAMNEDDYTKYSDNFDQTMKNAVPDAVFNQTNAMIKSKIGDYISKEFQKAEGKDQYTIVYYNATVRR